MTSGGLAVNYKGQRGFEDDYDYVMYGRVYHFHLEKKTLCAFSKFTVKHSRRPSP